MVASLELRHPNRDASPMVVFFLFFLFYKASLYAIPQHGTGDDSICWGPHRSKCFTISSYYRVLSCTTIVSFPWKIIWKSQVPPRVAFFVWTVALGRIRPLIISEGDVLVLDWCYMQNGGDQLSIFYFTVLLPGIYGPWCFELFGVTWVMSISVLDLLECWQGSFGRHRNFSISRVVPHCLMWCIWRERNGCSFEDCERSYVEIKLFFLRSLFDWVAG